MFTVSFLQHDAQMDYYGTKLATCSSDRSLKIFDVRSGQQTLLADLRGYAPLPSHYNYLTSEPGNIYSRAFTTLSSCLRQYERVFLFTIYFPLQYYVNKILSQNSF